MRHTIRRAVLDDLDILAALAGKYHGFEDIASTAEVRRSALEPLLADDSLGAVFLSVVAGKPVGYIALCFGYSIELGGREAFLDELYVEPACRSCGIGRALVEHASAFLGGRGFAAVSLEVSHRNPRGAAFYETLGFAKRERYFLMSRKVGQALGGETKPPP